MCGGTEITWDSGPAKTVCPKDRTPVNNYEIVLEARAGDIYKIVDQLYNQKSV